jgi:hypothetical protein
MIPRAATGSRGDKISSPNKGGGANAAPRKEECPDQTGPERAKSRKSDAGDEEGDGWKKW